MKITPSNQTLILANEWPGSGGKTGGTSAYTQNAAATGSVLQRVTILTARPDTLLYVRAEYAAQPEESRSGAADVPAAPSRARDSDESTARLDAEESPDLGGTVVAAGSGSRALAAVQGAVPSASSSTSRGGRRDAYGNLQLSHGQAPSYSLKPAEQYARTQRLLGVASQAPAIDVHA